MDAIPTIKTIDDNDVSQIRSGITNLNSIFVRRLQELFITKAASEIYFQDIRGTLVDSLFLVLFLEKKRVGRSGKK